MSGFHKPFVFLLSLLFVVFPAEFRPETSTEYTFQRDLVPLKAPGNLTLLEIKDRQVLVQWDGVDPESVRGNFKGYLVRTWNNIGSQVYAFPPGVHKVNVEFFPFSKNFITVAARNEKYSSPPSEAISFDAPQIVPNPPPSLSVFPLNGDSAFVQWTKPGQPNGILLGYKIYRFEVNDDGVVDEDLSQVTHQINDPDKMQAKLSGLKMGQTYRIAVAAINCAGEGDRQTQDIILQEHTPVEPAAAKLLYKIAYKTTNKDEECYSRRSQSQLAQQEDAAIRDNHQETADYDYFDYVTGNSDAKNAKPKTSNRIFDEEAMKSDKCLVDCLVMWAPHFEGGNPGEYFILKYKLRSDKEGNGTEITELHEDFVLLRNFNACRNYEMLLTTVDGEFKTESGLVVTPTELFMM